MFKLKENQEVGEYLFKLIDEKFNSHREFGKQCIKFNGGEINEGTLQNMSNRLSQIKNGNKSIQLEDLPVFTKLLDVSCEDILSAGEESVVQNNRLTNYGVAFSPNENDWEEYINDPDKPILHMDEYGNTVLDYAFKFKRIKFLNFLVDKKYVSFDNKYFTANSSIKSDFNKCWGNPQNCYLQSQLNETDFREKMIAFAISENNLKLLEQMHAREIVQFYCFSVLLTLPKNIEQIYIEDINNNIAQSTSEIINYFTEEFEFDQNESNKITVMYPFVSNLLDILISKNISSAEIAIKNAIIHNKKTYNTLKTKIERALTEELERINVLKDEAFKNEKPRSIEFVLSGFGFNEKYKIVSFRNYYKQDNFVTNIARISQITKDEKINKLITDLNKSYDKILNFKEEFEVK